MAALEAAGTEQNRKVYLRHGVKEPMFGVSYAAQDKLAKRIKLDHDLALQLWATGNHDARVLAAKVADPDQATAKMLESWRRDLDSYVLTDAFVKFVAQTPLAESKSARWRGKKAEWTARAGWSIVAHRAYKEGEDADYEPLIAVIENSIHSAANRARDAMLSALTAIGMRGGKLEKQAIAAARRIGPVEVDHGRTGCKTPDVESGIRRAARRGRPARS